MNAGPEGRNLLVPVEDAEVRVRQCLGHVGGAKLLTFLSFF